MNRHGRQAVRERADVRTDADSARLAALSSTGDPRAFALLYERYYPSLVRYARAGLGDTAEAEDVAQQTFEAAHRALPRYCAVPGVPFRGWLFGIARHKLWDEINRRGPLTLCSDAVDAERERSRAEGDDLASRWLGNSAVVEAFDGLAEPQRQVLMLRFFLDLSYSEVARVLDRSEASVRQLQHRGLDALNRSLSEVGAAPAGFARRRRMAMSAHPRGLPVLRSRGLALRVPSSSPAFV